MFSSREHSLNHCHFVRSANGPPLQMSRDGEDVENWTAIASVPLMISVPSESGMELENTSLFKSILLGQALYFLTSEDSADRYSLSLVVRFQEPMQQFSSY